MQLKLVAIVRYGPHYESIIEGIAMMTKADKLIVQLENLSGPFSWQQLVKLLSHLGYEKQEGSGSRVKFDNGNPAAKINLHKPHPGNELKQYVRKQIIEKLKEEGLL